MGHAQRVQAFGAEGGGRILDKGDVTAELHAKASGRLDAGVGDQADENELLEPALFELGVEIGVGEATLPPAGEENGFRLGVSSAMTLFPVRAERCRTPVKPLANVHSMAGRMAKAVRRPWFRRCRPGARS